MSNRQTVIAVALVIAFVGPVSADAPRGRTVVSIRGEQFFINGRPTYEGRTWNGARIEGLLLNSRMVQGIFDDLNPETVATWAYPDTGRWDPERNTREFLAAMPEWRRHGLLCVVVNLQGGSPRGYSREQPWHNSAFEADGSLRPAYMDRLGRIIDRADELGMVVMLGYFYFGQDQRLKDEQAVRRAVDEATNWLLDRGDTNVLVEVNNECDILYDHPVLRPENVHELISRVRARERDGRRLLVSTSMSGGTVAAVEHHQGRRLRAPARQRGERPGPDRRDGARGASRCGLYAEADPVQRGRPLRLREAEEQLRRSPRCVRLVGLFRLPLRGRTVRGGLPIRPGRLGHPSPPEAGVLRDGEGGHGRRFHAAPPESGAAAGLTEVRADAGRKMGELAQIWAKG